MLPDAIAACCAVTAATGTLIGDGPRNQAARSGREQPDRALGSQPGALGVPALARGSAARAASALSGLRARGAPQKIGRQAALGFRRLGPVTS